MEKKLTNSGPLREAADKHSIYAIEIIAEDPASKDSVRGLSEKKGDEVEEAAVVGQ